MLVMVMDAPGTAPDAPGVLQARGEALRVYPTGKSAMVFYDASTEDGSLRHHVSGAGAPGLARAATAGARFVRFGVTPHPRGDLARLLGQFRERFGAPPVANQSPDPRVTGNV